jgi:hypothetical protein
MVNSFASVEEDQTLEAYFFNNKLHIMTKYKGKIETKPFKFDFETKKWYALTITHEYHLFRSSKISLYINGEFMDDNFMGYPKIDESLEASHIASAGYAGEGKRTQALIAQFGNIYLLDSCLAPIDVKKVCTDLIHIVISYMRIQQLI